MSGVTLFKQNKINPPFAGIHNTNSNLAPEIYILRLPNVPYNNKNNIYQAIQSLDLLLRAQLVGMPAFLLAAVYGIVGMPLTQLKL